MLLFFIIVIIIIKIINRNQQTQFIILVEGKFLTCFFFALRRLPVLCEL